MIRFVAGDRIDGAKPGIDWKIEIFHATRTRKEVLFVAIVKCSA